MDYVIRNKYGYNMHNNEFTKLFGVPAGGHLPDEHRETEVQGKRIVLLTKAEAQNKRPGKHNPHRIYVDCPGGCGLIPLGRMHQHAKVHPDHERSI